MDTTPAKARSLTPLIRLQPSPIACILGVIAGTLVLISVVLEVVRYVGGHDSAYGLLSPAERLFHLDREQNVPTLFSVLLLLSSASLLGLIALLKQRQQDPDHSKWTTLTCGFIFMAIDEFCSIHEMLTDPMHKLLGHDNLGGFYTAAWVIPGMAGVGILALLFLGFLLRLHSATRWSFLAAGAIYLGGLIGVETIGGRYGELHGFENMTAELIAHLEESMEMAGMIMFIHALLRYLAEQCPKVEFLIAGHNQTRFNVLTSEPKKMRAIP